MDGYIGRQDIEDLSTLTIKLEEDMPSQLFNQE